MEDLAAEIKRLTGCLQRSNDHMDRVERELYQRLEEMEIRTEKAERDREEAKVRFLSLVQELKGRSSTTRSVCESTSAT